MLRAFTPLGIREKSLQEICISFASIYGRFLFCFVFFSKGTKCVCYESKGVKPVFSWTSVPENILGSWPKCVSPFATF